ncbi:MAG: hypothetical protein JWO38_7606 [Gemmataceae bacterium]|nr:hypothetical protein [Gemmataceae bacterium]
MTHTDHSPVGSPGYRAERNGRRGRRLAGLEFMVLAPAAPDVGGATANHQDQAVKADSGALPQEVRDGLDRAARVDHEPLTGAKGSHVSGLGETDEPLDQLRGTNGRGRTIEVEVIRAGWVIEGEAFGVPPDEVPAAMMEAVQARVRHANPDRVEAIDQAGSPRPAGYGFVGRDAGGKTVEAHVSADGRTFLN